MSFSTKLQDLRKQKGISQESLAEIVGVSRQAISKWESGKAYPDINNLIILSELFNCSIDSLVKDDSDCYVYPTAVKDYSIVSETNENVKNNFYAAEEKVEEYKKVTKKKYEYKSKTEIFGLPLVHINTQDNGLCVAKGIIAIGNVSIGIISIGCISIGLFSLGCLSMGIFSLGCLSIALAFSMGAISIAPFALGGIALGFFTFGGVSIGIYSIGGVSIGYNIAIGEEAIGHIAIGKNVHGVHTIEGTFDTISSSSVRELIQKEFPSLCKPILNIMTMIFK